MTSPNNIEVQPNKLHYCCARESTLLSDSAQEQDHEHMASCLSYLANHEPYQEVPVSAMVVHPQQGVLSLAVSKPLVNHDPTGHAEILALRLASKQVANYRLSNCTLYTTLEPCLMCFYAMMQARITRIVFAATDTKVGVLSQRGYHQQHLKGNHHFSWTGGVCAHQAQNILMAFFKSRRL